MSRMPGYVALILDAETRQDVTEYARYENKLATHVMMAFRPSNAVYNKYKELLGKELTFTITAVCWDEQGEALRVEGVPSENEHPHITISLKAGVKPAYSNELLRSPANEAPIPTKVLGKGTVTFVGYY